MIEFIDTRLRAWGHWSTMRLDGDLGTVPGFAYCEPEFVRAPRYCSTPLLQDQCLLSESAIGWLLNRHACLGKTVVYHYRGGVRFTADQRAAFLRVSRRAYWYRIEQAHLEILGYLSEREGGQVPQLTELMEWRRNESAGGVSAPAHRQQRTAGPFSAGNAIAMVAAGFP